MTEERDTISGKTRAELYADAGIRSPSYTPPPIDIGSRVRGLESRPTEDDYDEGEVVARIGRDRFKVRWDHAEATYDEHVDELVAL